MGVTEVIDRLFSLAKMNWQVGVKMVASAASCH